MENHRFGFDRITITQLRVVFDSVWTALDRKRRAEISQTVLAERIVRAAARGERDPERLRLAALNGLLSQGEELASR